MCVRKIRPVSRRSSPHPSGQEKDGIASLATNQAAESSAKGDNTLDGPLHKLEIDAIPPAPPTSTASDEQIHPPIDGHSLPLPVNGIVPPMKRETQAGFLLARPNVTAKTIEPPTDLLAAVPIRQAAPPPTVDSVPNQTSVILAPQPTMAASRLAWSHTPVAAKPVKASILGASQDAPPRSQSIRGLKRHFATDMFFSDLESHRRT